MARIDPPTSTREMPARKRILIADDNHDIQEMLCEFFSGEGFEVLQAFDGEEAIRKTASVYPNLVLLDMRMPREDGLDVLRRVRETDLDTAIILHTAFGSEALGLEALRAGADDYVKKPVELDTLLERVNAVLIAKEGHNALRRRAEQRMRESEELYRTTAAELAARVATIDITQEIARAVLSNLELSEIAQTIVTQWRRLLPYDRASIVLLEPDRRCVRVLAAFAERGVGGPVAGDRFRVEDSLLHRVLRTRVPLNVPDLAKLRDLPRTGQQLLAGGVHSLLVVPVILRDTVVGTINVGAAAVGTFASRHEAVATELVGTAAIAIQNALLYRDLRESYASLQRAQEELLRQERLAALGQISAVMAHEVRNPLGVIFNSLGPLRQLLRPKGDAAMLLSIIEEEAGRLNRIVGSLLDFARPTSLQMSEGDISELIDEVVRDSATDFAYHAGIEVRAEYHHTPGGLAFDAHLVRQALINLVQNAFQALPREGVVRIATSDDSVNDQRYVRIAVSDSGTGIREDLLERIFDPFFTTRAMGTGLGLPIVKRVADDHRGLLEVDSQPGKGTTFSLLLPRVAGQGPPSGQGA
jgi:signal transduction histidine kinase/DNA-binding response OmpR family regulator